MSPPGRSGKSMPRLLLRSVFSCPSVIFYLRLSSWQFAEFTTSSADHCYMVQLFTVSRGLTVTTSAQACLGCCWLVLQAPAERLFFLPFMLDFCCRSLSYSRQLFNQSALDLHRPHWAMCCWGFGEPHTSAFAQVASAWANTYTNIVL